MLRRQDALQDLAALNEELLAAQEQAARVPEEQRTLFERLQVALLDIPGEIRGMRLGHPDRSSTSEVRIGGDFDKVFQAKNGRVGLLIGDVSGQGEEAARIATLALALAGRQLHDDLALLAVSYLRGRPVEDT